MRSIIIVGGRNACGIRDGTQLVLGVLARLFEEAVHCGYVLINEFALQRYAEQY